MATPLDTLKSWFRKGLYPTQSQFWAWLDSFWHKDEQIPMSNIDNLNTTLNGKANTSALTALQSKTDQTLETEAKTIAGAINELNLAKSRTEIHYQSKSASFIVEDNHIYTLEGDANIVVTVPSDFQGSAIVIIPVDSGSVMFSDNIASSGVIDPTKQMTAAILTNLVKFTAYA